MVDLLLHLKIPFLDDLIVLLLSTPAPPKHRELLPAIDKTEGYPLMLRHLLLEHFALVLLYFLDSEVCADVYAVELGVG